MLIPANSSLRTEDFPSEQSWISKLLFPLNSFLISVTTALNGNITFGDNIPCQTIQLQFTYNGASDFPKQAKWSISQNQIGATISPPIEVRVCSATEDGNAIALVPAWSYANGQISFAYFTKFTSSGVSALNVGSKYNIILRGQP